MQRFVADMGSFSVVLNPRPLDGSVVYTESFYACVGLKIIIKCLFSDGACDMHSHIAFH